MSPAPAPRPAAPTFKVSSFMQEPAGPGSSQQSHAAAFRNSPKDLEIPTFLRSQLD